MAVRDSFDDIIKRRGDMKIHVIRREYSDEVEIWLGERKDSKYINYSITEGRLLADEVEEGTMLGSGNYKPLMIVPAQVWSLIKEAVFDHEDPPELSSITGQLKATERHLEDMRRLVFEEKVEITESRGIDPKIYNNDEEPPF